MELHPQRQPEEVDGDFETRTASTLRDMSGKEFMDWRLHLDMIGDEVDILTSLANQEAALRGIDEPSPQLTLDLE